MNRHGVVGKPVGWIQPIQWLNKINRNSTMDKPMRTVNARAMRRERCASPLLESPFIMAANAAPSAPTMPTKATATKYFMAGIIE